MENQWNVLVQSLKRLYDSGNEVANFERMRKLHQDGKITLEEFKYITGEDYSN